MRDSHTVEIWAVGARRPVATRVYHTKHPLFVFSPASPVSQGYQVFHGPSGMVLAIVRTIVEVYGLVEQFSLLDPAMPYEEPWIPEENGVDVYNPERPLLWRPPNLDAWIREEGRTAVEVMMPRQTRVLIYVALHGFAGAGGVLRDKDLMPLPMRAFDELLR